MTDTKEKKTDLNKITKHSDKEFLVSIIILTYKRTTLLKDAIESAINQTYKNIEILVVDDNDLDTEESEYVKNLVSQYKDVIYLTNRKNSGQCVSRDNGVEHAKGDFINFLDDDDLLFEDKIEKQISRYSEIINSKSDNSKTPALIGGYEQYIDLEGNVTGERINRINGDVFLTNLKNCICQTSVPIINRDTYIKAGGSGRISACTDHYLFSRILNVNPYYDHVDDYVVKIRHYDGPRVSNGDKKIKGSIELFEHFKTEFFDKLSAEEIREVARSSRENIVNAYLLFNDRKKAFSFFMANRSGYYGLKDNIFTLMEIILPEKVFSFLYKIINSTRT